MSIDANVSRIVDVDIEVAQGNRLGDMDRPEREHASPRRPKCPIVTRQLRVEHEAVCCKPQKLDGQPAQPRLRHDRHGRCGAAHSYTSCGINHDRGLATGPHISLAATPAILSSDSTWHLVRSDPRIRTRRSGRKRDHMVKRSRGVQAQSALVLIRSGFTQRLVLFIGQPKLERGFGFSQLSTQIASMTEL